MHDPEGEAKHGIKLSESLRRAQSLKRKLLEGHTFYVTKKLQQSDKFATYKSIIQSAGGKVSFDISSSICPVTILILSVWQVNTQAPTVRLLNGQKDRHLLSLQEDHAGWQGFADEGIRVYLPEFVLTGILSQRMEWGAREHRLDDNP